MEVYRAKVLELQRDYLRSIRERSGEEVVEIRRRELVVMPGVFHPYLDSELMIEAMRIEPDESVLDVGSGSGVIAVFAALRASRVVATDLNPAAVETIRANAVRHGLADVLIAYEADLFPPEETGTFDVVVFNPPYTDHPSADVIESSVWDPGHATVKRFMAQVPPRVKRGGRLYLGWADFADFDFIEGLLARRTRRFERIAEAGDHTSIFAVYEASF